MQTALNSILRVPTDTVSKANEALRSDGSEALVSALEALRATFGPPTPTARSVRIQPRQKQSDLSILKNGSKSYV
jgi:hypothetical protein